MRGGEWWWGKRGKRGLGAWWCQGRRLGHHITALCGAKIKVGTGTFAGLVVLLVVSVVVTVVDVVVSFGELVSLTAVVTLAVVVVIFVEVRVVTLGVELIVLLVVGSLVTSDLGFSVEVLITDAGLRPPIGFNS